MVSAGIWHRNKVNTTAWLYRDGLCPCHEIASFTLHYISIILETQLTFRFVAQWGVLMQHKNRYQMTSGVRHHIVNRLIYLFILIYFCRNQGLNTGVISVGDIILIRTGIMADILLQVMEREEFIQKGWHIGNTRDCCWRWRGSSDIQNIRHMQTTRRIQSSRDVQGATNVWNGFLMIFCRRCTVSQVITWMIWIQYYYINIIIIIYIENVYFFHTKLEFAPY